MKAADFCNEAANLVSGDRAETHGDMAESWTVIANLWTAYLGALPAGEPLKPENALDMMELMKIGRRPFGTFNKDDYTDGAGYAGCAGQVASDDRR